MPDDVHTNVIYLGKAILGFRTPPELGPKEKQKLFVGASHYASFGIPNQTSALFKEVKTVCLNLFVF